MFSLQEGAGEAMPLWGYLFLAAVSYALILMMPSYLGLLLAITCRSRGSMFKSRALIFWVDELPKIPFINTTRFNGLTIGHIVMIKESERNNARLLRHELTHVRQEERYFGPLFHVLYWWQMWREGYENNHFEIEAREKSKNA